MIKGSKQTEEAKKKLSVGLKKYYTEPEHRLKQSLAHIGYKPTPEKNQKISNSLKGRISPMLGKTHSEETCQKISKANKGKKKSKETRLNMSLARKGKPNGRKGIKLSEEHRNNIGNALRGKKQSPEICERLRQINLGRKQSLETIAKRITTGRARGTIGMSGKHHSDEAKNKMSIAKLGRPNGTKGRIVSEEARKKLSMKLKGRKLSEEHIRNISKSLKGVNTWMKGKKLPQETRDNMSKAFKGRIFSEEHKSNLKKMWKNPEYVKKITASKSQFSNNQNENRMKEILTSLEIKFETQKRMNIPHSYLCDFYLPEYNCIIEADGSLYHAHPDRFKEDDIIPFLKCTAKEKRELDAIRTKELQEAGYKILRFWENEFDEEIVKNKLLEVN